MDRVVVPSTMFLRPCDFQCNIQLRRIKVAQDDKRCQYAIEHTTPPRPEQRARCDRNILQKSRNLTTYIEYFPVAGWRRAAGAVRVGLSRVVVMQGCNRASAANRAQPAAFSMSPITNF